MTKREKELIKLQRLIARLERDRKAAIAALVSAENRLPLLRKQLERRLKYDRLKLVDGPVPDAGVAQNAAPVPVAHVGEDRRPADDASVLQEEPGAEPLTGQLDELEIPTYLRRSPLQPEVAAAAYNVANAHNKTPSEDDKKLVAQEKRKVREEHKQAELTGKRRKPPLTGREAEAFLRKRQFTS